jgi:peptide deformylase
VASVAIREIRIYGDPVLREKAARVERIDDEVRKTARDMLETLADADGVGLAGPQVGVLRRIIVVHPPPPEPDEVRDEPRVLVNPEVVERGGPGVAAEEGCLSLPGVYETVKRPDRVHVKATDLEGQDIEIRVGGMASRILQHEIDHLDGVLFVDRVGPMRRALLKKKLHAFRE